MIYSIIPARGGSKGVPGKNMRKLMGHPLIAYSIRASLLSKEIKRTIVSTDSEEIAKIAVEYGAEAPFLRPADISGDHSTDLEFIQHALNFFKENEGKTPSHLVHLRPTTPLREPSLIDRAIAEFKQNTLFTALRSAHEMSESAYKTFEIDQGILKSVCTGSTELDKANASRQLYPKTYSPNGYVDVLSTSYIQEHSRIHGNRVYAFITPTAVEVDANEDFELLDFLTKKDSRIFNLLFG